MTFKPLVLIAGINSGSATLRSPSKRLNINCDESSANAAVVLDAILLNVKSSFPPAISRN